MRDKGLGMRNKEVGTRILLSARCSLPGTLWVALCFAGCASFPKPAEPSLHEQRQRRDDDVARRLSKQRDIAEFRTAQEFWNQQDLQSCHDQLERLLARNPDHRQARLLMADVLVATKKPQEAIPHLTAALKTNPQDADTQYVLALTLDATGKHSEALRYYEQAARTAPGNEAYAMAYLTASQAVRGKKSRATVGQVANLSTDKPETGSRLPDAATTPEAIPATDASQALKCPAPSAVQQASAVDYADVDDKDPGAELLNKGLAALEKDSPQLALVCFRQAQERNPQKPQIPVTAATAALRHNQSQLAIDLLKPAAERFEKSAAVFRLLGIAYYRAGDYKSAQTAIQHALSLDTSNALSYFLMGCTLAKLGQLDEANAQFRQAQALDPRYAVRH